MGFLSAGKAITYRSQKRYEDEVRRQFQQDFTFFATTLQSWPLLKRLAFCRDVLLQRL